MLIADPDARPIAGGQTLVPMMAMRLARPSRLVDIARLQQLRGIRDEGDAIVFGAATRQLDAGKLPLLAAALPWVGHPPTRSRGTVGGSIANADPAAEIGLVLVTLEGTVAVREDGETKSISAGDLFLGPMTTALPGHGLLVSARFPVWSMASIGVGFHEVSARKSDFAYVSAAAQVALAPDGTCTRLTIGIGGATPVPTRLASVSDALQGTRLETKAIETAVRAATADIEIMHDAHATEAYRRRVASGLAVRALIDARDQAATKREART